MALRIITIFTVIIAVLIGLTVLFFYGALEQKHEEKTARLVIENNAGETITKVVVSLIGEPCRVESLANGDQVECIFTDLDRSDYAITFLRSNGEEVNRTNLGRVSSGLFWDDKITLGEGGEVKMTRGLPRSKGVEFN